MADLVSKIGNGVFALDGMNQAGQGFSKEISSKAPVNKYDQAMNNELVKVKSDFMGNTNALNHREASDIINNLYQEKIAYDDDDDGEDDFRSYYKKDRNFNSYDKKNNDGQYDYLPYAVLATTAVGLGAYEAYRRGDVMAPLTTAYGGFKAGLEKGLLSGPKNLAKGTKTGKILLKAIKQSNKDAGNLEKTWSNNSKSRFPNPPSITKQVGNVAGAGLIGGLSVAGYMASNKRRSYDNNKYAFEVIDDMYKEAYTTFDNKKQFAETLFKEDFVQNGLRAIPYTAVPIGLSYAINKNLKSENEPVRGNKNLINHNDRIVIDVPLEQLNKRRSKSAFEEVEELVEEKVAYEPMPMKEWFRHQLPREVVKGASWALFPAAVIAASGRNIRDMGQKVRKDNKELGPVESGKARITIEAGPANNRYDYRMASTVIDYMYKEATNQYLPKGEKELTEEVNGNTPNIKARITQGQKKQQKILK